MNRPPSIDNAIFDPLRQAIVRVNHATGHPLTRIPDRSNAVLMYHSVGNADFSADVPAEKLRNDLAFLVDSPGIKVADLPDVLDCSGGERKVALTFDDGYENFFTTALPLLEAFDVPATVFVNPAFLGDDRVERIRDVHEISSDDRIIMSRADVSALVDSPNVTLGNHTNTHPRLDRLDDAALREEILTGKDALESAFDVTVDRFCYPYGEYDSRSVELVAEHHRFGVTTSPFVVTSDTSRYELPRVPGNLPIPDLAWEITRLSDVLPFRDERLSPLYPDDA
jgi:peptidoglycan/xylan/chitin deacetylase (PgdA/CDA1 family)